MRVRDDRIAAVDTHNSVRRSVDEMVALNQPVIFDRDLNAIDIEGLVVKRLELPLETVKDQWRGGTLRDENLILTCR